MKKAIILLTSLLLITACAGNGGASHPSSDDSTTFSSSGSSITEKVTANFYNDDGITLLYSTEIDKGETPSYVGATPTKEATEQYTYSFKKWSPDIGPIFENTNYLATYETTTNAYEIRFVNSDGTELQVSNVEYGLLPEYKGAEPTKPDTNYFHYSFKGWDSALVPVTGPKTYTATFEKTSLYNYTVGDEYCWSITTNAQGNRKFVATSTESQMFMFNYETFSGGTIELDMTYVATVAKYNCASGIVFGASTLAAEHNTGSWACAGMDPWYDFVAFSKDSGDFRWEDKNKVAGIFTDVNKSYHIAFSWDPAAKVIHYLINDAYICSAPLTRPLSGQYLGIYSDTAGTIFENIEISSTVYHPEFMASQGTISNWNISNDKTSITAKATGKTLMMPQYDISESCYVEFDMNVPDNSTAGYAASGILLCGDQAAPSNSLGSYIVVGRDWWGGFDAFQMINGSFSWKDGNKIANAMPNYNETYHIKLYVNLETKNIQYFWNEDTTHGAAYDFNMSVAHFGIYDDGLFTISNINIHK